MYYYLLSSLKRRLILELQDSFSKHPVYNKACPYIQNKYAFEERPQFGLVVKGSSGNKVQLSSENFVGVVSSYVMLAYLDTPSYLLEWVREDLNVVRENGDKPPTPAGVYYIECLSAPTNQGELGQFIIDPLLTVTDEPLLKSVSGIESTAQLQNVPVPGTLRIWENRRIPLQEGRDYTVDNRGKVSIIGRLVPGSILTADYRYPADSIGPIDWSWNSSDCSTLPGVVLAFGKRGKIGDKQAVVVYEDREDAANAFGGRFDATFDVDVIATDPVQMEEMADYTVMSLWGEKRSALSFEGIEVVDVSMGGEAEESYDETADIYYYTASLSIQIQSDWEIHVPLPFTISRISAYTKSAEDSMTVDRTGPGKSSLKAYSQGGLFLAMSPILVGRNNFYERIT
jgi:hypothetical protein